MDMSISAMNYNNSSLQNKEAAIRPSTQTKDEEEGKITEVQRMQATESYRSIQAGQVEEQSYAGTTRMDRAEISEEGRLANAQMNKPTEEKDLSEYTDAELEQMYYRGEITLQEYEDETGKTID